jgi:predicted HTH domain antitoxin
MIMPLIIDDQFLKEAGLSEQEAKVEIACRLFEAKRLSRFAAGKLSGLDRISFDLELGKRGIDPFGYTVEEFDKDLETLNRMSSKS